MLLPFRYCIIVQVERRHVGVGDRGIGVPIWACRAALQYQHGVIHWWFTIASQFRDERRFRRKRQNWGDERDDNLMFTIMMSVSLLASAPTYQFMEFWSWLRYLWSYVVTTPVSRKSWIDTREGCLTRGWEKERVAERDLYSDQILEVLWETSLCLSSGLVVAYLLHKHT